MFFYAQLNENNICVGISQLSGEVKNEKLIKIDSFSSDYIWRKYEDGEWSTEKYEPETSSPLTEFEKLKAENESTKQALAELTLFISTMNGGM